MTGLLVYLLIGFALYFASACAMKSAGSGWKVELLAIVLWPPVLLLGIIDARAKRGRS